jgi:hypothetical protein
MRGSRIEVRGQLGDLITEPIQMGGDASGGFRDRRDADTRRGVHRRLSSVLLRRLYTSIFERPRRLQDERSWRGTHFLRNVY